jgi:2-hydroxy-6-oxonona-2,4-dienedioate hydrolase
MPLAARALRHLPWLRSDSTVGKRLGRAALQPVRAPTLIISARDKGYTTHSRAQFTAGQISGAEFVGFETFGHWIGHDDEVMPRL